MAYFKRMVTTGSGFSDPRSWTYAIYKCDACHKESEFRVVSLDQFQTRERKCPKCGVLNESDRIKTLGTRRQDILKQITNLNAELMDIETELSKSLTKETVHV